MQNDPPRPPVDEDAIRRGQRDAVHAHIANLHAMNLNDRAMAATIEGYRSTSFFPDTSDTDDKLKHFAISGANAVYEYRGSGSEVRDAVCMRIEKYMRGFPVTNPDRVLGLVRTIAHVVSNRNVEPIESIVETMFKNVPHVNVFETDVPRIIARSSMETLMGGSSPQLLRWFIRSGKLSPTFDSAILQCFKRSPKPLMLDVLLELNPDVFVELEVDAMHSPINDGYTMFACDTFRSLFDARKVTKLKGTIVDLANAFWGREAKVPGGETFATENTHAGQYVRMFRTLKTHADNKRLAQFHACLKRMRMECVMTVAEMLGTPLSVPPRPNVPTRMEVMLGRR